MIVNLIDLNANAMLACRSFSVCFPQVSGDNPVYVESVKPGGAAQKAGLMEGDMILKVNIQHPANNGEIYLSERKKKKAHKCARRHSHQRQPHVQTHSARAECSSQSIPQIVLGHDTFSDSKNNCESPIRRKNATRISKYKIKRTKSRELTLVANSKIK